eukprot:CAMPEP_0119566708 /NCGR_PEP_ID=MMETSP1352-20130426/33898_1 /TAXON_ID=265584 /ORGANISM="Stauroneis constricta, Strain CCMP1120" /LENGTH=45 /DNA_ID= /DNA_START= /DNA_END= /DNA_ORIENTATION=
MTPSPPPNSGSPTTNRRESSDSLMVDPNAAVESACEREATIDEEP